MKQINRGSRTEPQEKKRKIQHEGIEQEILFKWAKSESIDHPELNLLFHIPNGGKRSETEAKAFKRQGVKAGVPDIFLPVSREGSHGLFIELKYGTNRPTKEQLEWIKDLRQQNYTVSVCYGWVSAAIVISDYLGFEANLPSNGL